MSGEPSGAPLSRPVDAVLREFVNALGKAAVYPSGHRIVTQGTALFIDRLDVALAAHDALAITILPRGLMVDGVAVQPLSPVLRDFASRMHRRNIAGIHLHRGLAADEAIELLATLAAADAGDTVGRDGLRLPHASVEPMIYDVLRMSDAAPDEELDEGFWMALVAAAVGRRMAEGEALSGAQLAETMSERVARSLDGARHVFDALSTFATSLTRRMGRVVGSARQHFAELLAALSQPTTTRVMSAAPTATSRRRFVTDTLDLVPPDLVIRLLESVAEADGEPISPQLRSLLGKLAAAAGPGVGAIDGGFALQVLGLVEQWEGEADVVDETSDGYTGVDPERTLTLGLGIDVVSAGVLDAAHRLAGAGRLVDVLALLDHAGNNPRTVRTLADAILDAERVAALLAEPTPDFPLVERVALHCGVTAVAPLLAALGSATERATRRRLLDILVRIGPASEPALLAALDGAPWYLARNILAIVAQFPAITDTAPVFAALSDAEPRVRQEALKVLARQPGARGRAITQALSSGEEPLVRMALTALGGRCPPPLVAVVVTALDRLDPELQVLAIRALGESDNPLIAPRLLRLVAARRGLFRRTHLLPRTPAMLAALEVLARRWRTQASVPAVLDLAARSGDADVRAAAGAER